MTAAYLLCLFRSLCVGPTGKPALATSLESGSTRSREPAALHLIAKALLATEIRPMSAQSLPVKHRVVHSVFATTRTLLEHHALAAFHIAGTAGWRAA